MSERKFKVGQVVHVTSFIGPDTYGRITGYDDRRWHVQIGLHEHKVIVNCLRALTKEEWGAARRGEAKGGV